MIETRKYLKEIINCNLDPERKVQLLSELVEQVIDYSEELKSLQDRHNARTKKILSSGG
jgi:hypothetical protein|tara:strand:+ start:272 stop:448 length:177 start_codon:yes stop_codon:yes gene_type:complete